MATKVLSSQDFSQRLRDNESIGVSREKTYSDLKSQGYIIEGEPNDSYVRPAQKGGLFNYLSDVVKNGTKEFIGGAKIITEGLASPIESTKKVAGLGKDILTLGGNVAVGAGQNLYEAVTGSKPPIYNPDGTITYPEQSIYENIESGGTPSQRIATGLSRQALGAVYDIEGDKGFTLPETFRERPLSTLSVVAPLGAGSLSRASGLAKAGGMVETASALQKASTAVSYLDPVTGTIKVVQKAPSVFGGVTKGLIGAQTGAGAGAIDEALKATSKEGDFFKSLRDPDIKRQAIEIRDETSRGLSILRQRKMAEYKKTQEGLRSITETVDPNDIYTILQKNLDEFGITKQDDLQYLNDIQYMDDAQSATYLQNLMEQKVGTLPPLVEAGIGNTTSANKIAKSINYVESWSDFTPDGIDRLKKSLNTIGSKVGTVEGKFISNITGKLKKTIETKYPEYSKMMKDYSDASDFIDEITSSIGDIDTKSLEQTLRKMSQAMKTDNQGFAIRNALLGEIEKATGVQLRQKVAGVALSSMYPRGLAGVQTGFSALATYVYAPQLIPALALSIPRVAGEVLGAIGVAKNKIGTVIDKLRDTVPPQLLEDFTEASVKAGKTSVFDKVDDTQRVIFTRSGNPPVKIGIGTPNRPNSIDLSDLNQSSQKTGKLDKSGLSATVDQSSVGKSGGAEIQSSPSTIPQASDTVQPSKLSQAKIRNELKDFVNEYIDWKDNIVKESMKAGDAMDYATGESFGRELVNLRAKGAFKYKSIDLEGKIDERKALINILEDAQKHHEGKPIQRQINEFLDKVRTKGFESDNESFVIEGLISQLRKDKTSDTFYSKLRTMIEDKAIDPQMTFEINGKEYSILDLSKQFEDGYVKTPQPTNVGVERLATKMDTDLGNAIKKVDEMAPKVDDALMSEARKYKSAEKFVMAQGTPVKSGDDIVKSFDSQIKKASGVKAFDTTTKLYSEQEKLLKRFYKPLQDNVDDINVVRESTCVDCVGGADFVNAQMDKAIEIPKRGKWANKIREEWDGMGGMGKNRIDDYDTSLYLTDEYLIFQESGIENFYKIEDAKKYLKPISTSQIQTKSQLTEIWKKANQSSK